MTKIVRLPFIIARRTKEIELPGLTVKLAGEFKFEAVRSDGTRRVLADWFPNLITNIGLDSLNQTLNVTWCRVGTGNTAPTITDTQLVAQVASTSFGISTTNTTSATPPYYVDHLRTYQFGQGVAAGNLAEVGVGTAATGATLFSRALILDSLGNPTTITVLSDEFLNVSYRLRQFAPAADRLGTFGIGSNTYDYTARAQSVNSWPELTQGFNNAGTVAVAAYDGTLGAITGSPSGFLSSGTSTYGTYVANNFYRDVQCVFSPVQAVGTHRCYTLSVGGRGRYQFQIDPTIVKTNLDTMTMNFRVSWQRIVGTG